MPAPLTVDKLRELKFRTTMHVGGSGPTVRIIENDEFGLVYSFTTNGRPDYQVTSRRLATQDDAISIDLLVDDCGAQLQRFVDAYNAQQQTQTAPE